jgi:hypothetical protein
MPITLIAVMAVVASACAKRNINHPVDRDVVRVARHYSHLSFAPKNPTGSPPLLSSMSAIAAGRASAIVIGAKDTPIEEVFETLVDAGGDALGRVFVLDGQGSYVRVFDRNGRFLQTLGRPGILDGEFTNPLSITVGTEGEVYVGDLAKNVTVFERSHDSLQYSHTIRLSVSPSSMCILGGNLFVHGVTLGVTPIVHEFDLNGRLIRSFGQVYTSGTPIIDYTVSHGRIACDEHNKVVVFGPTSILGELQGYDTTGATLWQIDISDYKPATLIETEKGYAATLPQGGHHSLRSLVSLPDGYVLAQFGLSTPSGRALHLAYSHLSTVVVDALSGQAWYAGDSLPQVSWIQDDQVIMVKEDSFPRVLIHPRQ